MAEFDMYISGYAAGGRPMNIYTRGSLLPIHNRWTVCPAWGAWLTTDGKEGEEPPDEVKRLREIFEEGMVEPSEEKRDALLQEAFDIFSENLFVVGCMNEPDSYKFFTVKSNLRNWNRPGEPAGAERYPQQPATWFFK